jgi:acetyl esterase/lipase
MRVSGDLPLHERRVVYKVPGMSNVCVKRDVTYKSGDGTRLEMDVYTPAGVSKSAKVPGVLFIHGGPIRSDYQPRLKNWGQYLSYGELIAASGLIGVTFNHRYYDYSRLEQSAEDVDDAIRCVCAKAELFNLDPDRMCLWAFSGGGPQLSLALQDGQKFVRCIVAYYAILDLRETKEASATLSEETLRKSSLVSNLSRLAADNVPVFIARAGLDRPELNKTIDFFIREALVSNVPLDFANHPQGHHAFDVLDDNPRSRWIIAKTIEFLKVNLQKTESTHLALP